ncbi:MAG: sugar transferase [Nitrospirae bacterium]|nr:sugar transferase [Nitrospirota bacterium]
MKKSPVRNKLLATIRNKIADILSGTNGKIMFNSSQANNTLLDDDYELYIEHYFNQRLCFERKRTERSKNPFLMMLLNIEEFKDNKNKIIGDVTSALLSSTRETDIKGWYRHDYIIGVIFTEISNLDMDSIEQKIVDKLYDTVGSAEDVNKIKISIYIFPEKDNGRKPDSLPDLHLYPDVTEQGIVNKDKFILKRIIDIGGSLAGLFIFAPFFIFVPIIIKLTSKGPILFSQDRIGLNGEKFKMLKFRSMYINNNPKIHEEYIKELINGNKNKDDNKNGLGENGVYKIMNDPRVTPIGRFLRKTSLDELPQFINVLIGNMSLVGPRPPLEYELVNYDIWHRRRIFSVKPGITGLWQVKGRSVTTFDEMVRMDLKYTRERSLWLDLVLLLQTVRVVLNGKGAY